MPVAGEATLPVPHPVAPPLRSQLGRRLGAAALYTAGSRLLRYGRGCDNRRLPVFAIEARVEVGPPLEVGATPRGLRRIGPILRGTSRVPGPGGACCPGGAD